MGGVPLYDAARLHRFLSEPEWTAAQWQEADRIVRATVTDLASGLNDAIIEPQEFDEVVAVGRDGRVYTTAPVAELIAMNGVVATDGAVPAGWTMRRRYLYRLGAGTGGSLSTLALGARYDPVRPPPLLDQVAVHYVGGWTDEPALGQAILTKAGTRMARRHSDTMNVTGLTATPGTPQQLPMHWTPEELAALGPFRRLVGAATL